MPLIFILIFGSAFSETKEPKFKIGIVDKNNTFFSKSFVEFLKNFPPNSPLFEIQEGKEKFFQDQIKKGKILGYIVLSENFDKERSKIIFVYNEAKGHLVFEIQALLKEAFLAFLGKSSPVKVVSHGIKSSEWNYLSFLTPGMIVYGLMILIPVVGGFIARDRESFFIKRLKTTPLKSSYYILGYFFPFFFVSLIQIIIYLLSASLIGIKFQGDLFLLFLVFLIVGICSLNFGLIVGSLSKNSTQAQAISWIFIVPLAMISGAWFPVDQMKSIFIFLAKIFPFFWACSAGRNVAILGVGLEDIFNEILILISWSFLSLILGFTFFKKFLLGKESQ